MKSLSEINNITTPTDCVTIGTIGRIIVENHGWCCNKSAVVENGPFKCSCGKYNEGTVLRYKLEVMVYHKKQSSNFVLWDHECMELRGKSAQELNDMMFAGGDKNVNVFPDPLDDVLGCTLAFKIKVEPKYRNSSVNKIFNDPKLMQAIMDLLPDIEDSVEPQLHLSSKVKQSPSGTADHDPEVRITATPTKEAVDEVLNHDSQAGIPVTPTKRGSAEVFVDDILSEKFPSPQLSATKKHSKNE